MKTIKLFYFVLLQLLVLFLMIKTNFIPITLKYFGIEDSAAEITPFYHQMMEYHRQIDKNLPAGSVIFIGDSLTQGLAVSAISPCASNYGIGMDTTIGVIDRVQHYASLNKSAAVIIAIGLNDLKYRDDRQIISNYEKIINKIPDNNLVFISSILPVIENREKLDGYNERIQSVNKSLQGFANGRNIIFVDSASALETKLVPVTYHLADGVHLNAEGYARWIVVLQRTLEEYGVNRKCL